MGSASPQTGERKAHRGRSPDSEQGRDYLPGGSFADPVAIQSSPFPLPLRGQCRVRTDFPFHPIRQDRGTVMQTGVYALAYHSRVFTICRIFAMSQSTELAAAIAAARAAGDIIRSAYRTQVAVEIKADSSPVTEVDIACEHRIREILSDACPGYGFYGEETGQSDMDSEFVWLVDPLDGTKSFVRGYPFISTQIALMRGDDLVLGVSAAPLFDELAWAEVGQGAWLNNDRLRVSEVADWGQATLSTGNIGSLAASSARWSAFGTLVPQLHRVRGYGDFYHYHLLSAGRIDAVLESDLNILDIAANTVILREAGGVVTDLDGQAIGLDTRSTVAGNAILQPRLLELMQG